MSDKDKKHDEKMITMTGDCSIKAAAVVEGEETKLPSVKMEVYNGGKINVGYWGAVAVDLKGMTANDATPILYAHDSYSIDGVLGQTDSVVIGDSITATGSIMGSSETTEKVKGLAKNGYKFQVSMGASPIKTRDIPDAESVDVNGQTLEGPFTLIVESKLSEISILPLGADDTTSADIAASHNSKEGTKMSDKKTPAVKSPEEIRAEAVKDSQIEVERIQAIKAVAKDNPEIMAQAVKDGWDAGKTENAVLKAENAVQAAKIEASKVKDERPPPFTIGDAKVIAGAVTNDSITAAVCMSGGMNKIEASFDTDTLTRAGDIKIRSLTELAGACLAKSGRRLEASHRDPRAFIEAAFSTADISNVISNVANKFIASFYGINEQAWKAVSSVRSVSDFKQNTGVRLIMSNLLKALAPNGEIQHGAVSDTTRTITADTKALMLGFTRKDIINDDLSVLPESANKLAFAAYRTFNTDFYAALEAAVTANFTGANKNTTTGALTIATLKTAEALFLALEDDDGNPIGTNATTLLCGTTAYNPARTIFASNALVGGGTKSAGANIYSNMFTPVFSSYLAAAPWYLVGNPIGVPLMESAFLNGNQMPVVETAETDFNTLGIQMRCYYDYGVSFAEAKSAVYSTGA